MGCQPCAEGFLKLLWLGALAGFLELLILSKQNLGTWSLARETRDPGLVTRCKVVVQVGGTCKTLQVGHAVTPTVGTYRVALCVASCDRERKAQSC